MRRFVVVFNLCLLVPAAGYAQYPLGEARRLYNGGQYDAAERAARLALANPGTANGARVVLGRAQLERYRQTDAPADLAEARAALREVDPRTLDAREKVELTIGLAETLFLEDRFASAAEIFATVLESSRILGSAAHARVLDWWATSLDKYAQSLRVRDREPVFRRISDRMQAELTQEPGSATANYWAVASVRGVGDIDAAWNAAMAAWVRAGLGPDRGAAVRSDLDRMVLDGIIPDRAARLELKDPTAAIAGMVSEWELFKSEWTHK
ncbi:MAG TPA: hypothetical protein VM493_04190 [Vicinamibacterales bacterium]|nr:hypothetical protein [Vicinamibacterales bacterium]